MGPRNTDSERISSHIEIPGRPDLVRLGIGIIGIGTSGPLIALSVMPIPALIFGEILVEQFCSLHLPYVINSGVTEQA